MLQHDANLTLSGGDSEIDGDGGELVGRKVGAQKDLADLRPVAVGDHKLGVAREGSEVLGGFTCT